MDRLHRYIPYGLLIGAVRRRLLKASVIGIRFLPSQQINCFSLEIFRYVHLLSFLHVIDNFYYSSSLDCSLLLPLQIIKPIDWGFPTTSCATLRALTFPSVRSPRASQEIFAFSASFLKLEIAALTGLPSGVLYPPHGVEAALSAFGDGVKAF